ncbi:FtsX-like permease family protein [Kitasatospora viridis]|uniref:FtsX-like permease family protein n=1 Tax=Kitasatospora viridis TaxID=281105 RepID=A0A561UDR0_9ACTN|nr:FtsX-like permease family protein [Kitasatospora viridis]TWF97502.1 FtsX-like permease family protein [Kitasatospora viridis]
MGGFVLRRLRSRLALAGAAMLTILLTAAVLATLIAFDNAVGVAGERRALAGQDRARAAVLATTDGDLSIRGKAEQQVRQLAAKVFGDLPTTIRMAARGHALALPQQAAAANGKQTDPDLTMLDSLDPARVSLSAGRLPRATAPGAPIEVAAPDAAIGRLGLKPTALPVSLQLVDRFDSSTHQVLVTGTYHPTDITDPYWQIDPLGGRGVQVSGFTTYGPLLAPDNVFTDSSAVQQTVNWLITADFSHASLADLDAVHGRIDPQLGAFQNATGWSTTSQLPTVLDELHNDLLAARSTLVIGALQLAVLAIAALVLVTRLLSERQSTENALLTARGAAWYRIAGITALEAGVLALPGALFAPLLVPALLGLLGRTGALARVHVPLGSGLNPTAWLVSVATSLVAVLIVLAPTVLRAGGSVIQVRAGRRQAMVSGLTRSGGDLVLLVLAVLAYLQLRQYGSGTTGGALSTDSSGHLGLDPVLVVAPTLALCAGTVLALRLLPVAARFGERWAVRGAGLPTALAGWQFARRPRRNTGPVLLMVLAVSMGILALGQSASLSASQRDQADFSSVGGLRITQLALPSVGQAGLLASLPGGDQVIPVSRQALPLASGKTGQLLALDADKAAQSVRLRSDLSGGRGPAQYFGPITRPAGSDGLDLPGQPLKLTLDLSVSTTSTGAPIAVQPDPWMLQAPWPTPPTPPTLILSLHDRVGNAFTSVLSDLPLNGDATVDADFSTQSAYPAGRPSFPLTLTSAQLNFAEGSHGDEKQQVTVHRITSVAADGSTATTAGLPNSVNWQAPDVTTASDSATFNSLAEETGPAVPPVNPTVDTKDRQDVLRVGYYNGLGAGTNSAVFPLQGPAGPAPTIINALVTKGLLTELGAKVGQTAPLEVSNTQLKLMIVGVVPAVPTVAATGGDDDLTMLVDLPTLSRAVSGLGGAPPGTNEWWLPSRSPGDPAPGKLAAALRASVVPSQLQLDDELVDGLRLDPLAAAPQAWLLGLTVTAAVLAAIGFAAAAIGAAAERATEFAVLRALGTPARQLARTAAAEQGILIALGLGLGTVLGALLTQLVVPLTVLTPTAQRPMPPALVVLPTGQVLLLLVAVAALPALLTLYRVLRPARAGETTTRLRHSEEM